MYKIPAYIYYGAKEGSPLLGGFAPDGTPRDTPTEKFLVDTVQSIDKLQSRGKLLYAIRKDISAIMSRVGHTTPRDAALGRPAPCKTINMSALSAGSGSRWDALRIDWALSGGLRTLAASAASGTRISPGSASILRYAFPEATNPLLDENGDPDPTLISCEEALVLVAEALLKGGHSPAVLNAHLSPAAQVGEASAGPAPPCDAVDFARIVAAVDSGALVKAGDALYTCPYCHCSIPTTEEAHTHLLSLRHRTRVELARSCLSCGFKYCSITEFDAHLACGPCSPAAAPPAQNPVVVETAAPVGARGRKVLQRKAVNPRLGRGHDPTAIPTGPAPSPLSIWGPAPAATAGTPPIPAAREGATVEPAFVAWGPLPPTATAAPSAVRGSPARLLVRCAGDHDERKTEALLEALICCCRNPATFLELAAKTGLVGCAAPGDTDTYELNFIVYNRFRSAYYRVHFLASGQAKRACNKRKSQASRSSPLGAGVHHDAVVLALVHLSSFFLDLEDCEYNKTYLSTGEPEPAQSTYDCRVSYKNDRAAKLTISPLDARGLPDRRDQSRAGGMPYLGDLCAADVPTPAEIKQAEEYDQYRAVIEGAADKYLNPLQQVLAA